MHLAQTIRELRFRLSHLVRREALDRELKEEIQFHHELLTRELEQQGLSPPDAVAMARRRFGNQTLVAEAAHEWWGSPGLDVVGRDVRHAWRRLRRSPVFSLVVIATFALGIGANVAVFTLIDAALLRPLPFRNPDDLVMVRHSYTSPTMTMESEVSVPGYNDYRARSKSFAVAAAERPWDVNVMSGGAAARIRVGQVTPEYFGVLGVAAKQGRTFSVIDDQPGGDRVVVVSDGFWRTEMGGDAGAVGRSIELDGARYVVIGVMPVSFRDAVWRDARAWTPVHFTPAELDPAHYTDENLDFIARLKPGVTLAQSRADLSQLAITLRGEHPGRLSRDWTLSVGPLGGQSTARVRTPLLILFGAVVLVLAIACANIASLLLARVSTQRLEVAVRSALGGGRAAILRHLLIENAILATCGGLVGVAIARWSVRLLWALSPIDRAVEPAVSVRVVLFALGLVVLTTLVCGLAPIVRGLKVDETDSLVGSSHRGGGVRYSMAPRLGLVGGEIALAIVLVAGAAMMIRSVERLRAIDPGFDPRNLTTFKISLASTYATSAEQKAFFDDALARISRLPGVRGVAATNALPFAGNNWNTNYTVEGFAPASMADVPWGDRRIVNPDYHAAMQVALRSGRYFTVADLTDAQSAAIVDEVFARRYLAGRSPIGRRISFNRIAGDTAHEWSTIVGVVAHVAHEGLDAKPRPQTYQLYGKTRGPIPGLEVAVRTRTPDALVRGAREAVRSVDRGVAIADVRTMEDRIDDSIGQRRLLEMLLATFSALSLLLAAVGVYGAMSCLVAQRAREFGIRRALGARISDVVGDVLRDAIGVAVVGAAFGIVIAAALSRVINNQLFNAPPVDPVSLGIAGGALVCVALLAALAPAWRATRADPMIALRDG